jgi:hypothetical protein
VPGEGVDHNPSLDEKNLCTEGENSGKAVSKREDSDAKSGVKDRRHEGRAHSSAGALPSEWKSHYEFLQWGNSFLTVADGLRVARVSRAHRTLAIQLWDPAYATWSEVIDNLKETLEAFDEVREECERQSRRKPKR